MTPCLLVLLAASAGPPTAQDQFPDLVPAEAHAAVGIRDWDSLCVKAGRFAAAIGKPGVEKQMRGLGALASASLGIEIEGRLFAGFFDGRGFLALPLAEGLDMAGTAYGFKKGELRRGSVEPAKNKERFFSRLLAKRDHLYLGQEEKPLQIVAGGKSVSPLLRPLHRRAMSEADLAVHLSPRAAPDQGKLELDRIKKSLESDDPAEKQVAAGLVAVLETVQDIHLGFRFEDTFGLRFLASFGGKPRPEAAALLKALRGKGGASSLAGLPAGRVVAAHAASVGGDANALVAKLLLRGVFANGAGDAVLSAADQPLAAGVVSVLWRRVQGRRLAVYHNEDELKHGLLGLVAVLDSDDPERLMAEIGALAKFAKGKDLDLSGKGGKGADAAEVRKLLADLDSDEYPVRQAASVKLSLIGEPALPFVEKAAESGEAEVRRRATKLLEQMRADADIRRKEALSGADKRIRPGFVLERAAEKLDGHKIDVLSVKLEKKDAAVAEAMAKLAGPGWAKIRLATVGKKVVALVGSDVALLKQTLKNVKDGTAGLEASAALAGFRKAAASDRKLELHAAIDWLAEVQAGLGGKKMPEPGALSSLSATLDETRLDVGVWLTPKAFRAIAQGGGFWRFLR